MKKVIYTAIIIAIQHSTLSIQNSFAQAPFHTPDNIGSGNCLSFNDNGDRVDVGLSASLRPTNAMTLTAWLYSNDPFRAGADMVVTNDFPDTSPSGYALFVNENSNDINFVTFDGTWTNAGLVATNAFQANEWFHLAATFDGTTKKIYVNGMELTSTTWANTISYADNPFYKIGTDYNDQANRSWNGKMDELTFWNKALTQAEIRDYMCRSLQGNEPGLMGYWNMNDGTGNTVGDLTSNNNDGTRQ